MAMSCSVSAAFSISGRRFGTACSRAVIDDRRAAGDHGDEALRHQQRQRHVNDDERHDRRHAEKMHQPDVLETAEQAGQLGELHRLPQRQAGNHDQDADQHDAEIEHLLHGVVMREIVMAQTKPQRFADRDENLAWPRSETVSAESGR